MRIMEGKAVFGSYHDGEFSDKMILSILVDTFFTRISMPKLQLPESRNISAA